MSSNVESPLSTLSGWGGHKVRGRERCGEDLERISCKAHLSRGLGRSYGDSSLPSDESSIALNTTLGDRILSFDDKTDLLKVESGFPLTELNRLFIPRGWSTPVSPGTQYVTLGGMVAADVHGKNQHCDGNFGHHVQSLRIRVADGRVLWCSRNEYPDLFAATIGGMGLTGHILEVEFGLHRIPSPWFVQQCTRIGDIDEFQDRLEEAAPQWPHTMGWIDGLRRGKYMGRGILMCGRRAESEEAPGRAPGPRFGPQLRFTWPSWVLNRLTIAAFNELYYRKQWRRVSRNIVSYDSFYYPLDAIRSWNRMYGRRGFTQYQCVLPRKAGRSSARRVLQVLTSHGGASFLCVIKDFGRESFGFLSFPQPGITLALDIAVRDNTQKLVDALNDQVIKEGGRVYLAKDSFTRREHFEAMEGERLQKFQQIRNQWDPNRKFRSAQSVRLLGD